MMDVFKNVTLYKKQPVEGTLFNYLFSKTIKAEIGMTQEIAGKLL